MAIASVAAIAAPAAAISVLVLSTLVGRHWMQSLQEVFGSLFLQFSEHGGAPHRDDRSASCRWISPECA
jgi:hypothetical protein